MLGKTYLALKDKENAHLWLTKARDYRPITTEDKEVGLSRTQMDGTLENNTYSCIRNGIVEKVNHKQVCMSELCP